LVGSQQGHDLPSCELLLRKELRRHLIPVDDDPLYTHLIDRLLIAVEQVRQSNRQVLIPSMCGGKPWVSLRIVQQHQFATAQDFPVELAHRPSRTEHGTVDSLAVSVHVEHGWSAGLVRRCLLRLPQGPRPPGHRFCQAFSRLCAGQTGQKLFGISLTVDALAIL
jgi:hypothetical protein